MTPEPSLVQGLKAKLREERRSELAALPLQTLAWLALAPRWSVSLAEHCELPAPEPIAEFVSRLADEDIVRITRGKLGTEFWLDEGLVSDAIAVLRPEFGALDQQSRWIATRIKNADSTSVPLATQRWASLQGLVSTPGWLAHQVDEHLKSSRAGQALDLIDTADRVARFEGGALAAQVRLARYRLDRFYRQQQDRRLLENFLPRQEQLTAFDQLLEGPDELWALHYVGLGGVGKTMLIRNLVGVVAPERGIPVARVDFDNLSADYPARQPGQLLAAFAQDLVPWLEREQHERSLQTVYDWAELLEQLATSRDAPSHPLENLQRPEFVQLLNAFSLLLRALGSRVLLVLDTCEELNKLEPVNGIVPAIEATFHILRELQRENPQLRVVFAGRRLLAHSGHGFRVPASGHLAAPLIGDRPFLRLHEIRGFTTDEAQRYVLSRFNGVGSRGRALLPNILALSPEVGRLADVVYEPARNALEEARFNPFDLSLYCDWIESDDSVDAAKLSAAAFDPYVEGRIAGRLGHLRDVLPAVAFLGRFDESMLRAALGGSLESARQILGQLSQQEWIRVQPRDANHPPFYEVEKPLRARLSSWVERFQGPRLSAVRANALAPLCRAARELPLEELEAPHIDAALRCGTSAEAIALWQDLEQRVACAGRWDWAYVITRALCAEGSAAEDEASDLWPWIWATHASALLHEQPELDLRSVWQRLTFAINPVPEQARVSEFSKYGSPLNFLPRLLPAWRALFGFIAARARKGNSPSDGEESWDALLSCSAPSFREFQDRAPWSYVAALEALVEQEERFGYGGAPDSSALPSFPNADNNLQAFVCVLKARLAVVNLEPDEVNDWFERAYALHPNEPVVRYPDWRAPAFMLRRVELEHVRAEFHGALDAVIERFDTRVYGVSSVDDDRLQSALLEYELARRQVPLSELEAFEAQAKSNFVAPTCNAHSRFSPLAATVARAFLALGLTKQALQTSESLGNPLAQFVGMEIFRRARFDATLHGGRHFLNDGNTALKHATANALFLAADPPAAAEWEEALSGLPLHVWWSLHAAPTPAHVDFLLERARASTESVKQAIEGEQDPIERAKLILFWREVELLSQHTTTPLKGVSRPLFKSLASVRGIFEGVSSLSREPIQPSRQLHGDQALELYRLRLREWALSRESVPPESMVEIGPRAMAEAALEEGELLAARLAHAACKLLDFAVEKYREAQDPIGAAIATSCALIARVHSGASDAERIEGLSAARAALQAAQRQVADIPSRRTRNATQAQRAQSFGGWYEVEEQHQLLSNWITRVEHIARDVRSEGDPKGFEFWTGPFLRSRSELSRPTWIEWISTHSHWLWPTLGVSFVLALVGAATVAFRAYQKFFMTSLVARLFPALYVKGLETELPIGALFVALGLLYLVVKVLGVFLRTSLDLFGDSITFLRSRDGNCSVHIDQVDGQWAFKAERDDLLDRLIRSLTGRKPASERGLTIQPDVREAYVSGANQTDLSLRRFMTATAFRFGVWRAPVALRVSDSLGYLPWEAYLTRLSRSAWRLSLYRSIQRRISRALEVERFELRCPLADETELRNAWGGRAPRLCHVVGRGLETASGFEIDIGNRLHTTEGAPPRGVLEYRITPKQLACRLAIVQGSLLQEARTEATAAADGDRTPELRLEAAQLRRFALALIDRGVEAVLVLPPLHRDDAFSVIQTLSATIPEQGWADKARLLRVARAVREKLVRQALGARHIITDDTEATEAALDVTLFLREDSVEPRS